MLTIQEETQDCFKSEFVAQQLCAMLAVLDPSDEVGRYVAPNESCDMLPRPSLLTQASSSRTGGPSPLNYLVSYSSHHTPGDSADQDMATGVTQVQCMYSLRTVATL